MWHSIYRTSTSLYIWRISVYLLHFHRYAMYREIILSSVLSKQPPTIGPCQTPLIVSLEYCIALLLTLQLAQNEMKMFGIACHPRNMTHIYTNARKRIEVSFIWTACAVVNSVFMYILISYRSHDKWRLLWKLHSAHTSTKNGRDSIVALQFLNEL